MNSIKILAEELRTELESNILPYWNFKMSDSHFGGFFGRRDGYDQLFEDAPKGAILHARILWTFSAAYRLFKNEIYLDMAIRAKDFILAHLEDDEFGGIYWSVTSNGKPLDTKKQFYAIGFAIYGFSEFYRATGDQSALYKAIELFDVIEKYSFDKELNGYIEACTREWTEISDMRLSLKDANEKKTMNTHLHILEPYTNLYRVWKSTNLQIQLKNLIELFIDKIVNSETGHLQLFFNDNWESKSPAISFGHDIEAVWLIHEAAEVLDDKELLERVRKVLPKISDAATEGLQTDGSLIYEFNPLTGHADGDRHWWVQAEAMVGYFDMWQLTQEENFLDKVINCWGYIKTNLMDNENGEWYWSVNAYGSINRNDDKAGFWKCPYHNGRMCLEIYERINKMIYK